MIDILAVGAIGALVMVGSFSALGRAREQANRVKCASNLRAIANAIMMYANNETRNGNAFPRTYYVPDGPLTQTDAGSSTPSPGYNQPLSFAEHPSPSPVGDNNVMASIFLILKTQDLTAANFVCPSTELTPDAFAQSTDPTKSGPEGYSCWNAPANAHLSYSMQVPFASKTALLNGFKWNAAIAPDFAIAGDINPGATALLSLTPNSSRLQMMAGNSLNHETEGQNVVYGDGHVEWMTSPFAGATIGQGAAAYSDNIYTYGRAPGPVGIIGPPQSNYDSILLPVVGQGFVMPQKSLFERNPLFVIAMVLGIAVLVGAGIVLAIVLLMRKPRVQPPPLPPMQ